MSLVVYKPATNLREIIWVGAIAVCPSFRNPLVSQTPVTLPAIFSFLQFFISAKSKLVGRVKLDPRYQS